MRRQAKSLGAAVTARGATQESDLPCPTILAVHGATLPKGVYERTPEMLANIRAAQRRTHVGRVTSPETKEKLSAATRGRAKPIEWRERMRGEGNGRFTHGMSRTPTWQSWVGMRTRCFNPNSTKYPIYGARGITVCDRWLTFENFLEDMGVRPDGMTLDRIDVDGDYEPANCRWATPKEQRANQRPK